MKFNNKETYLAYRSEWKARYKNINNIIRGLKAEIRDAQQNKEYAGGMQISLKTWRENATNMLTELKEAKQEAQRQYLASKERELVTA